MNETEFIFWLKGFTDNMGAEMPTREQWDKLRHELALVFNKVTPYRPNIGGTTINWRGLAPIQGEVLDCNARISC